MPTTTTSGGRRKTVVVVKHLNRDASPKKQLLVSRAAHDGDDIDALEESFMGNQSPHKLERSKDGTVLARSVLGDPMMYEQADKGRNRKGSTASSTNIGRRSSSAASSIQGHGLPDITANIESTLSKAIMEPAQDDDDDDETDLADDPDEYLQVIKRRHQINADIQEKEAQSTEKMIHMLPLNQKFSLNREGKVLTLWQERQRDWERIQASISKRLDAKNHSLMMETAHEFRARTEEYNLLLAAVPPEEHYGNNAWQRTLRGGGPRKIAIGHIFSGIECEVEDSYKAPKIVRKAYINPNSKKGKTMYIDETEAVNRQRKRLSASLAKLRPHTVTFEDACDLQQTATDLFQWAYSSSDEYFNDRQMRLLQQQLALQLDDDQSAESCGSARSKSSAKSSLSPKKGSSRDPSLRGALSLKTQKEVFFCALTGQAVYQSVTFVNNGPVTLTYSWKEEAKSASDAAMMEVSSSVQARPVLHRDYYINSNSPCFFCLKDKGTILPGDTVTTIFTLFNTTTTGVVSQTWQLETYPRSVVTPSLDDNDEGSQGSPYSINLRGYVLSNDQSALARSGLASFIDCKATASISLDEFNRCFRRVRDPVRSSDLDQRKVALFRLTNASVLAALSRMFGDSNLFISATRISLLGDLCEKVTVFNTSVVSMLVAVKQKAATMGIVMTEDDVEGRLESITLANKDEVKLRDMRNAWFPEHDIDVFDEIDEQMITPSWDYDVSSMRTALLSCLRYSSVIKETELLIAKYEAVHEKQRLREERRAKHRQDNPEDDDDEEEEEDDDEEEEEEGEVTKHALELQAEQLLADIVSKVSLLVLEEMTVDRDTAACRALVGALDQFEDWDVAARIAAGIAVDGAPVDIPTVASPFTSDEGAAAWRSILEASSSTTAAPVPAKGKGKADPNAGAQQVNCYYKQLHDSVYGGLLAAADTMFADIDSQSEAVARQRVDSSTGSGASLFKVAAFRKDDISAAVDDDASNGNGTIVYVNIDGHAFDDQRIPPTSAFDVTSKLRSNITRTMVYLAEAKASAIVLFYSNESSSSSSNSSNSMTSLSDDVVTLKTMLDDAVEKRRPIPKRRPKGYVESPFTDVLFDVTGCHTISEMLVHLPAAVQKSLVARATASATDTVAIPVILVDNLSNDGMVPSPPSLPAMVVDDEEAPVAVGQEESVVQRERDWVRKGPHKVSTTVIAEGTSVDVNCYADIATAFKEACSRVPTMSSVLVDSSTRAVFAAADSTIQRVKDTITDAFRVVSDEIREAMVWCGTVQLIPRAAALISASQQQSDDDSPLPIPMSIEVEHMSRLFPSITSTLVAPRLLLVIGGDIRYEKFSVLDSMLDLCSTVVVCGELALPFLSLSDGVVLAKYSSVSNSLRDVCLQLRTKARSRGVKVVLPVDVVTGDEPLKDSDKSKCFETFDPAARDEGVEYEGETKILVVEEVVSSRAVVSGYVYDVGPLTCQVIRSEVADSDIVLVWGTVGACEFASFQSGQRALVESAVKTTTTTTSDDVEATTTSASQPLHTLVVGDASVEWFARVVDSDGDIDGDLVKHGRVAFASRESSLVCGLLTGQRSTTLSRVQRRDPIAETEMTYNRVVKIEEEDDDDEEEEEED